jgi:cobalt/nickel transport system permease protein
MHIPDGYLGPATYGGFWVLMAPIWMYASKKVKEAFEATRIPFLAMASAFSLVAMVFTVPLPGGTTGHITGAPLIAILLGPWAAVVAVSIAVVIQALVLGDGGITAIGANCFNIAFIGSFVGYGTYALITRIGKALGGEAPPTVYESDPQPLPFHLAGAAVGAYIGMNAAALFTALELGVQPLIYASGTGGPHYFPFPPSIAIPAIMIPHLTAVGGLEAAVAVLVLTFLRKSQAGALRGRKMATALLAAGIFFLGSSTLYAHDFWIEQKGNDFVLIYGHGTQREEFETTKVKDIRAFDDLGKPIEVRRERTVKGLLLKPVEQPALLVAEIDDGYWSKTIYGWKNLPKRKASRVVEASRSISYSKALVSWSDIARKPSSDLKLEIIPLRNPFELKAGDSLPVRVLFQGTPLPAETVEGSEHEKVATTDRDGVANVRLTQSHQVIKIAHRERLKDDPDADYFNVTTTLTFEVRK